MRKKGIDIVRILTFILMVKGGLFAQTITLLDRETGRPIVDASLSSQSSNKAVISDLNGHANLTSLQGSESIVIQAAGYQARTVDWTVVRDENFLIYLSPAEMDLEEVVLTATRWRQVSEGISSKIISISPQQVSLQNPQTAADLLGLSGKVFIQKSQQGGGSPMIRGFAANRLVYTVDGVRMNTAIFRSGNIQNVINLDPFSTEKAEVLFGPGSVIYGSDAIGGVMSFRTLTPQLSDDDDLFVTGKANARFSSANNELTGHFDVNLGGKKWAFLTSFSAWDYDHLRQGQHGPADYVKPFYVQRQDSQDVVIWQEDPLRQIPSGYSQVNFLQKLRYTPRENWNIQYGFHFSRTSPYGRYDRHNRSRNSAPRYGEWSYGPQQWMMNLLTIEQTQAGFLYDELALRIAHQTFRESRISRNFNAIEREIREEEVTAFSANLDFKKTLGSRHTLFYGAEAIQDQVSSSGQQENLLNGNSVEGPSRYPEASWRSLAIYAHEEFRVNGRFSLQAGARYNHFLLSADFTENEPFYPLPFKQATLSNGAVTGSLGGVLRPGPGWTLKANLGTAFRSPNVDDIGKIFDSEPGAVVVPNSELKAEYAYNADLSIVKTFGDVIKIDVTGYYTWLDNALVRRNFQLDGKDSILYEGVLSQVQAMQNAAVAYVYGVQAGIEVNLPGGLSLTSDFNYQKGIEELDDGSVSPSRHAAPMFGVTRLTYQEAGLTLQLYAQFQGSFSHDQLSVSEQGKTEIYALDSNGNTYAPAWYTLNLKAQYELNETFSFSAGMENLTDQRYRPYSSGISGAGRNFVLSGTARF